MKRIFILPLVLLCSGGCLAPVTRRLDTTNQEIATTNAQLAEANQRLASTEAKLDEANRRIGVIDTAIEKLLPGLNLEP